MKPQERKELIIGVLAETRSPMNISSIESRLPAIGRKTLIRDMNSLIQSGRIEREGVKKSTVYKITNEELERYSNTGLQTQEIDYLKVVKLSPESRKIREYVRQPLSQRERVNYERFMLDEYIPNETFYLEEVTRKQLKRIGETGDKDAPAGTHGRHMLDRLLIDLSWSSSKLEGNTYSLLDTETLIKEGREAEGKNADDAQMILNHKTAIEFIIEGIDDDQINKRTFTTLHYLLSDNLMPNQDDCGRLRTGIITIGASKYHPTAMPQLIEELFDIILTKASQVKDPFEQSFFLLVHIPYLQAFQDVNKRTSRLGANIPLLKNNLCPLTYVDMPKQAYIDGLLGVYELNRIELYRDVFVHAYVQSTRKYVAIKKELKDPDPIRLKYRKELINVVNNIVTNKVYPYETSYIKQLTEAEDTIQKEDFNIFAETAMEDIKGLRESALFKYKLKQSDLVEWNELIDRYHQKA